MPASLVTGDGVRDVGLLKGFDLLGGQLDAQGADGVFEVLRFGSTNDGGGDPGFVQHPGQSNPGGRHAVSLSQGLEARDALVVSLGGPGVEACGKVVRSGPDSAGLTT